MNKNYIYTGLFITLIILVSYFTRPSISSPTKQVDSSVTSANCLADDCLLIDGLEYPVGTLSSDAKVALDKALDDEYKAYSTYEAIIAKLGSSRPFSMIIGAEDQHISQLLAIYAKYGETPITNKYLGKITSPPTLSAACAAGVQAEIDNGKLYQDQLLPSVLAYPDITLVFTNLMDASLQKHLPAFERCYPR